MKKVPLVYTLLVGTIYLSHSTQTAETTSPEPVSWIPLYQNLLNFFLKHGFYLGCLILCLIVTNDFHLIYNINYL